MADRRTGQGQPIIAQIVALVAASVALATAVLLLVTFQGPPPRSAPVPLTDVSAVLQGDARRLPQGARLHDSATVPPAPDGFIVDSTAKALLAKALQRDVRVYTAVPSARHGGNEGQGTEVDEFRGGLRAAVDTGSGWRILDVPQDPWLSRWHLIVLAAMAATFVVLTALAWMLARRIAGPLQQLAEAADSTHARASDPPVLIDGPQEVRRVAEALIRMRDRLSATMATRTEMLTGIAHDMGTPLARIAFHTDALPDPARAAVLDEIAGIRSMIGSVLDFAREMPSRSDPVDIAALLRQLAETHPDRVTLIVPETAIMWGDATALKRLLANLVDNAIRYAGSCVVSMDATLRHMVVRVTDDGPGLGDDIAQMFEPFVRGERSRSRDTGGVGLGLTIARRVAEAHGGGISARNRAEGGSEFRVILPV